MHIPPINRLDPQQKEFLKVLEKYLRGETRQFGNQWICGFAGSGKSVLLAYSVKYILNNKPNAKIMVVVFTHSLIEMFKADFSEIGIEEENYSICTYYGFMQSGARYDYILCDEVQDLTPRVLREMYSRSSHIVVAGDNNQSIYDSDPRWHEATVTPSEIGRLVDADSFELNIIHRLSRSIIDAVQRFLPRMNIFAARRDMTKSDTQIRLCEAPSERKEVHYIMEQATKAVNTGYSTAVLIPTQRRIIDFVNHALADAGKPMWYTQTNQYGKTDFGSMNTHLKANGIKMQYVGNGYGQFSENDHRIVIMTYCSAKGLDFDNVFIPFANASLFISPKEEIAKTLFMVAMTRARENLYITYYGYPSDYLEKFKSNCAYIDIASTNASNSARTNNNNIWGF